MTFGKYAFLLIFRRNSSVLSMGFKSTRKKANFSRNNRQYQHQGLAKNPLSRISNVLTKLLERIIWLGLGFVSYSRFNCYTVTYTALLIRSVLNPYSTINFASFAL